MLKSTTGSCLCGGVTYQIMGDLRPVVACHCKQCRKTSGHYVASTQCKADQITIKESTLRWYQSSDTAERGFCQRCGGNLFWRRFGNAHISIWAGSIDDPTGLTMNSQLHAQSKGDYYDLPAVPCIEQSELL